MPKKAANTEKTYQQLQDEVNAILEKLTDSNLGLDEASKYYKQGMELIKQMEEKLDALMKEVSDAVEE